MSPHWMAASAALACLLFAAVAASESVTVIRGSHVSVVDPGASQPVVIAVPAPEADGEPAAPETDEAPQIIQIRVVAPIVLAIASWERRGIQVHGFGSGSSGRIVRHSGTDRPRRSRIRLHSAGPPDKSHMKKHWMGSRHASRIRVHGLTR